MVELIQFLLTIIEQTWQAPTQIIQNKNPIMKKLVDDSLSGALGAPTKLIIQTHYPSSYEYRSEAIPNGLRDWCFKWYKASNYWFLPSGGEKSYLSSVMCQLTVLEAFLRYCCIFLLLSMRCKHAVLKTALANINA